MIGPTVLLDSNLLVLYIVGATSREYIAKHKRLSAFTGEDYDALLNCMEGASILVTPNILTETSNLLKYIADPAKSHISAIFQRFIFCTSEQYVQSSTAGARTEFMRLGLTDSAILESMADEITVLTADLDLYLAAVKLGKACNFNHIREQYL